MELSRQELFLCLLFEREPVLTQLGCLRFVQLVFDGVKCHVVELCGAFYALLTQHIVEHHRAAAKHCFRQFGIGNHKSELIQLLTEELFGNHAVEHLLLKHGVVNLAA